MDGLKGRLLVASPLLGDPNFERTVVLVLEHQDEGALGVVLNRPSRLDVAEPLPGWSRFTNHPDVVFVGGPVSRNAVIGLAQVEGETPPGAWEPVLGPVGVLDLSRDPDTVGPAVAGMRVFAGYAGWGPGQLEGEIGEGAWYVVGALTADAFSTEPERLWQRVLARQPGDLARVALVPPDPRVN
jgi:putative transcriptional regulator